MKKIYQTVIDQGIGNCMQAAVASLFDKELDEVPNFILLEEPMIKFIDYFEEQGYDVTFIQNNRKTQEERGYTFLDILEYDGGINGHFYATVNSQTFKDVTHAVIIDKTGTVVHDPNPNGKCLGLTVENVIQIVSVGNFYIDFDGTFQQLRSEKEA